MAYPMGHAATLPAIQLHRGSSSLLLADSWRPVSSPAGCGASISAREPPIAFEDCAVRHQTGAMRSATPRRALFRRQRHLLVAAAAESPSQSPSAAPPLRSKAAVKQVMMVDPVVAKRMAEEDMQQRIKRAALKRRQEIEATNGGWAMVGLSVGLIGEGITGQGILAQVSGYLDAVAVFLEKLAST